MKRIVREVENILYLCGFFGRKERIVNASIAEVTPSDDVELELISSQYKQVRERYQERLQDLRVKMNHLDRIIDKFNKLQFYTIDSLMTNAMRRAKWYRRIFMDKRIPRDVLRETMVDKKHIEQIQGRVERLLSYIVDPELTFPIIEEHLYFIVNFKTLYNEVASDYNNSVIAAKKDMIRCKTWIDNTLFWN